MVRKWEERFSTIGIKFTIVCWGKRKESGLANKAVIVQEM
jgi:hypothetical protein